MNKRRRRTLNVSQKPAFRSRGRQNAGGSGLAHSVSAGARRQLSGTPIVSDGPAQSVDRVVSTGDLYWRVADPVLHQ